MLFEYLARIVADNNLIEKSKKLFWEAIKTCQQDNPKIFSNSFYNYDTPVYNFYK